MSAPRSHPVTDGVLLRAWRMLADLGTLLLVR